MYRRKGDYRILTGLACQTVVEPEMNLVQLPYISSNKPSYAVRETDPDSLDIVKTYPELMRCMGCNTCTKSCPVNIPVMDYVSAALRGDLKLVFELSVECVMCGLARRAAPRSCPPTTSLCSSGGSTALISWRGRPSLGSASETSRRASTVRT